MADKHEQDTVQVIDSAEVTEVTVTEEKTKPETKPPTPNKKEEILHPRVKAKLEELKARGLLTSAKTSKPPSDGK